MSRVEAFRNKILPAVQKTSRCQGPYFDKLEQRVTVLRNSATLMLVSCVPTCKKNITLFDVVRSGVGFYAENSKHTRHSKQNFLTR
jgi:hypothetical protein